LKFFAFDLNASQIAKATRLNRNTINRYLKEIRERIARYCESQPPFSGEVEVEEAYLSGGIPVFGIYQSTGEVYTRNVPDPSEETLNAVIRTRIAFEGIIHFDELCASEGLREVLYRGYKVQPISDIKGIRSFWQYVNTRFSKLRGVSQSTFYLHLKECEFRFNHGGIDLYPILITMCRRQPLFQS